MKYIKLYEENNYKNIKVNDYVILDVYDTGDLKGLLRHAAKFEEKIFKEFVNNNIGIITRFEDRFDVVDIKYHDIPYNIQHIFDNNDCITLDTKYVLYNDQDFEDLKLKYESGKYNL